MLGWGHTGQAVHSLLMCGVRQATTLLMAESTRHSPASVVNGSFMEMANVTVSIYSKVYAIGTNVMLWLLRVFNF